MDITLDSKNKLPRLPLTIFENKKTKIKNEVVKTVELIIINENRRRMDIRRDVYYKLKFNPEGTLDNKFY